MEISAYCADISLLLRFFRRLIGGRVFGRVPFYYVVIIFVCHNAAALSQGRVLHFGEKYGMSS